MGTVNRLRNRIEPFAALPRPCITPPPYTKHVLIWSGCLYGGGELVQFSSKTRVTPLFLSSMLLYVSNEYYVNESLLI